MKNKKVAIIGVGNVGSTLAYSLAKKDICDEIVLKDIREDYTKGLVLDISQTGHTVKSKTIVSYANTYEDLKDSNIIAITAGAPRLPGMSREDLVLINSKIIKDITLEVIKYAPNSIIIVVSNPLDAMVYTALKVSNFSKNKVIGMAGILDSARLGHYIFEKLKYGKDEIEAVVIGEHGDNMIPLANYSKVQGIPLKEILNNEEVEEIFENTKKGGAKIVKYLQNGSAYFAPAYSTILIIEAILNDTKEVFPCAVMLDGEYGYKNIVNGVPIKIGKNGVEEIIELILEENEKEQLKKSIQSVQNLINIIDENIFNI